jgi:lipoprotein-anchoring transpeptidase ErfK/SrfK
MKNELYLIFTTVIALLFFRPCFADDYQTQDFSPEVDQSGYSENDSNYTNNENDNTYNDDGYSDQSKQVESENIQPVSNDNAYADNNYYDQDHVTSTHGTSKKAHPNISGYGERTIIVNPHTHRWAAYTSDGTFVRGGLASAGSTWCRDLGHPCRTRPGSYRINSLGSSSCKSTRFPIGKGGAPMPYCMFFNGNQALHGSHELADANISHGCVRISVEDAEWIRFNFATIGTKVIIKEY